MFQIKRLLKNERIRYLLISLLVAAVMLAVRRAPGVLANVSDLCFCAGMVHILVGATRYIHNVGLFKTFGYTAYKRRWRKHGHPSNETRPMTLAEYTANVVLADENQKPVAWFLIAGVVWCAAALALALIA